MELNNPKKKRRKPRDKKKRERIHKDKHYQNRPLSARKHKSTDVPSNEFGNNKYFFDNNNDELTPPLHGNHIKYHFKGKTNNNKYNNYDYDYKQQTNDHHNLIKIRNKKHKKKNSRPLRQSFEEPIRPYLAEEYKDSDDDIPRFKRAKSPHIRQQTVPAYINTMQTNNNGSSNGIKYYGNKTEHALESSHFKSYSTKNIHEVGHGYYPKHKHFMSPIYKSHKKHHNSKKSPNGHHTSHHGSWKLNHVNKYHSKTPKHNRIQNFRPIINNGNNSDIMSNTPMSIEINGKHALQTSNNNINMGQPSPYGLGFNQNYDGNNTPIRYHDQIFIKSHNKPYYSPNHSPTPSISTLTTDTNTNTYNDMDSISSLQNYGNNNNTHHKQLNTIIFDNNHNNNNFNGYAPDNDEYKRYKRHNYDDSLHSRSSPANSHHHTNHKHRSRSKRHKRRKRKKRKVAIVTHAYEFGNKKKNGRCASHLDLIRHKKIYKKTPKTKQFLRNVIKKEVLFYKCSDKEIKRMVDYMYKIDVKAKECVVKQGELGSAYFIIQKGYLEQWEEYLDEMDNDSEFSESEDSNYLKYNHHKKPKSKKMRCIARFSSGYSFGADALLLNEPHKFTFQAPDIKPNHNTLQTHMSTQQPQHQSPKLHNKIHHNKMHQKPMLKHLTSFEKNYDIPKPDVVCRVWALDSKKFKESRDQIANNISQTNKSAIKFFRSIKYFKDLASNDLQDIINCSKLKLFKKDDRIIEQGMTSIHFYIIKTGNAKVVKRQKSTVEQGKYITNVVAKYKPLDSFGEKGIMTNKKRAATVIVTSDTMKCYMIASSDFKELLKHENVKNHMQLKVRKYKALQLNQRFTNRVKTKLNEFVPLGVLGVGAFGRVTLVEDPKGTEQLNREVDLLFQEELKSCATEEEKENLKRKKRKKRYKTYALKRIRKNRIIETGQQTHIINEKRIMAALNSKFCAKLFGTYKDELNIYFLLEPILGGELFSLLRANGNFNERQSRFYSGCVVLAFEYLHNLNIIYRDLKPENLLINNNGYCKLVDFGFAKKRNETCTLCGTPQYLAPEVIQNHPHNFTVDWYTMGILLYEMLYGRPPFETDSEMKMYEKILQKEVSFPSYNGKKKYKYHSTTKDLITKLLKKKSHERLGAGTQGSHNIKNHAFYKKLNWNDMQNMQVEPPYIPNIKSDKDVSRFEYFPDAESDDKLHDDPKGSLYAWCKEF